MNNEIRHNQFAPIKYDNEANTCKYPVGRYGVIENSIYFNPNAFNKKKRKSPSPHNIIS
jgi:hypothetical protein